MSSGDIAGCDAATSDAWPRRHRCQSESRRGVCGAWSRLSNCQLAADSLERKSAGQRGGDSLGEGSGSDIGNVRARHAEGAVGRVCEIAVVNVERLKGVVAHVDCAVYIHDEGDLERRKEMSSQEETLLRKG